MNFSNKFLMLFQLSAFLLLTGCGVMSQKPIQTVDSVNLDRFMGDWYVIASIPTFIEKDAYNAVESYELIEEGTVKTTFTFRKGGFDGEKKTYHPTGYVKDKETNSVWGMQFIWPIKADYRIVYLDGAYTQTVIGRQKRDYAWIMARSPSIPGEDYRKLLRLLEREGYDISKIRKVPHQWSENGVQASD